MNSFPNNNILNESKFIAFADDKIIMTQKLKILLERVENIVGKRRKCWLPAFSPFLTMFSDTFFSAGVKSWDREVKG